MPLKLIFLVRQLKSLIQSLRVQITLTMTNLRLKLLMILQKLIATVKLLSHQLMSLMKNLKNTLIKFVIESSTSVKATMMSVVKKKKPSGKDKNSNL